MNPSTQHTHEQNATMIPLRLSRSSNLTDLIIGITTSSACSTSRRDSFQQLQQQQQQQQQSSTVEAIFTSVKQQQEQLGPLAVVCGRGRVAQTLAGNKRFQCVIEEHLDQYITLKTKQDKSKLIRYVSQLCCDEIGFQFVKKQSGSRKQKIGYEGGDYINLNEQEILNKIGHSFRDSSMKQRKTNKSSMSSSIITKQRKQQQQSEQQIDELCYYIDCCSDNDEDETSSTVSSSSSLDSLHSWMYDTCAVVTPISIVEEEPTTTATPILDNYAEQYLLNLCADDDCSMEPVSIF